MDSEDDSEGAQEGDITYEPGENPEQNFEEVTTLTGDFPPLAGKEISLQIKARIIDDADLSAYADNRIPNKASLRINNRDEEEESNIVTN